MSMPAAVSTSEAAVRASSRHSRDAVAGQVDVGEGVRDLRGIPTQHGRPGQGGGLGQHQRAGGAGSG